MDAAIITFGTRHIADVPRVGSGRVLCFYSFCGLLRTPGQADSVSALDTGRDELQQDIKLMKDIV